MNKFGKILLILMIGVLPVFAFDFGSKLDNMADSISNKLFDKASDTVMDSVDEKPNKSTTKVSKNTKMEQLKELIEMKKKGYITDREFNEQKKEILSQR